jgi:hypothetical protein
MSFLGNEFAFLQESLPHLPLFLLLPCFAFNICLSEYLHNWNYVSSDVFPFSA